MKSAPWVLLLLALGGWTYQNYRSGELRRDLTIAEANTRAALDTTRTTLTDSLAAATRLAEQSSVQADSLSGALADALQDRSAALRSLQRTRIRFDSVVALAQTPTVDTIVVTENDTIRVASFPLGGPPIEGVQTVRVGAMILLDSRLNVSPFSITYGVACSGSDAVFAWETPPWVRTSFESGTIDPLVCNPAPRASLLTVNAGKTIWLVAGGLLGYVLGSH